MSEQTERYAAFRADGTEVQSGDEIKDFRGDPAVFKRVSQVPTESSGGKIEVRGAMGERYPAVYRLEIRRRAT